MALFRSCSVHREAELLLKSSSSIFLYPPLVLPLIWPPFHCDRTVTEFRCHNFRSIPLKSTPSPLFRPHRSPTFNLMVAWLGSGPEPGCESPWAVKVIASQGWSVCLQPDLVCRRKQRGPYRAPRGGLVPRSQRLGLLARWLDEALLWPQRWVTAQAEVAQAHTHTHTLQPTPSRSKVSILQLILQSAHSGFWSSA